MQFKQTLVRLLFLLLNPQPKKGYFFFLFIVTFVSLNTFGQTTYLLQDDKQNILLERMEILGQKDSILNFSKTKPFSRKQVVMAAIEYKQRHPGVVFSKTDEYNLQSLYRNNIEYLPADIRNTIASRKSLGKNFYRTPANLYEVHSKDFDLVINPVFQFVLSKESDNDENLFLNSRGVAIRGMIANKIGFSASIVDNQERDPIYVQEWENKFKSVPGAGYYKDFKGTGFDYFDARGYFTFNITKYIDVAFGYDRNFIGNGHRSLFLSDFSNNILFLKLNTRIWKLNYQNLFMELHTAEPRGPDRLLPKKYAVMHHLDVNVTRWLNLGLFEGVMFGRKSRFEFGYLNPVIFYRSVEQQNGSFDNSVAGIDFKANVLKQVQFYGQFLLDEFNLSQIRKGDGWWANKWGLQLGAKYINAFTIKNLDLQLEHNRVRPFTYSHRDSVANYTHYNQPLAHPLMANFGETIGIIRYQPAPKWMLQAKAIYYQQGRDADTVSYGSNIFLPSVSPYRTSDYGFNIGSGWKTNVMYASLLVSYELKANLFLELSGIARKQETKTAPILSEKSTIVSFGVRWNMHRREFDF